MKITIDTQTDTHEDIKKVLHVLTNIIEKKDAVELVDSTPMMGMFGDSSSESQEQPRGLEPQQTSDSPSFSELLPTTNLPRTEMSSSPEIEIKEATKTSDSAPDFSALLNLTDKEEPEKKDPEIEFF